jgi:hypothetical protein
MPISPALDAALTRFLNVLSDELSAKTPVQTEPQAQVETPQATNGRRGRPPRQQAVPQTVPQAVPQPEANPLADMFGESAPQAPQKSAEITLIDLKQEIGLAYEAAADKNKFQDEFLKTLSNLGAKSLKELKPDKYADVMVSLSRIG